MSFTHGMPARDQRINCDVTNSMASVKATQISLAWSTAFFRFSLGWRKKAVGHARPDTNGKFRVAMTSTCIRQRRANNPLQLRTSEQTCTESGSSIRPSLLTGGSELTIRLAPDFNSREFTWSAAWVVDKTTLEKQTS